jgi:hypothetical protein
LSPGLQQLYICSDPWLGLLFFCYLYPINTIKLQLRKS